MKKFILFFAFLIVWFVAKSQLDSTRVSIGNFLHFDYKNSSLTDTFKRDIYESKTFGVAPEFGFFLSRYFSIGANLSYIYNESFQLQNRTENVIPISITSYKITDKSSTLGMSVFGRFYRKISKKFYFTLQAELNYSFGFGKFEYYLKENFNDSLSINYVSHSFTASISPGVQYLFNKHLGLGLNIGKIYYNATKKFDNYNLKEFYQSSGLKYDLNLSNFKLGLFFYF